ncbi:hypothetical protein ACOME3_004840 [Neoechinorhynchus agilis]
MATALNVTRYVLAFITAPSQSCAAQIAEKLVTDRLAACVNIVPGVESVYHWDGKIEKSQEVLMVVKTKSEMADNLREVVNSLHPYDTCEIIFSNIDDRLSDQKYLRWIDDSVRHLNE